MSISHPSFSFRREVRPKLVIFGRVRLGPLPRLQFPREALHQNTRLRVGEAEAGHCTVLITSAVPKKTNKDLFCGFLGSSSAGRLANVSGTVLPPSVAANLLEDRPDVSLQDPYAHSPARSHPPKATERHVPTPESNEETTFLPAVQGLVSRSLVRKHPALCCLFLPLGVGSCSFPLIFRMRKAARPPSPSPFPPHRPTTPHPRSQGPRGDSRHRTSDTMSADLSTSRPILELAQVPVHLGASGGKENTASASTVAQLPSGKTPDFTAASAPLEDASSGPSTEKTTAPNADTDQIRYRIEYVGKESGSFTVHGKADEFDASKEPPVFEYVEVRLSSQKDLSLSTKEDDIKMTDRGKGRAYINILSPAVAEALRCVVDYYPELDLSGNVIKIPEPYSTLVFFEKELTEYRERAARLATVCDKSCPNRWAARHIGIVQDFVRQQVQEAVDAERARHVRGYATFDMLWLLYKPGSDVFYDIWDVIEHEPYVVSAAKFDLVNGATTSYRIELWNIKGDSEWVGPAASDPSIEHFAGEKKIPSLSIFPCDYLRFADNVTGEDVSAIKQHFVDRGRKWYNLRRKIGCYYFDGITVTFPRRSVSKHIQI